ncbi:MAG: hypothetical protein L0L09_13365 [Staphylococcus equorum]|nr:hypothetical protein [Staphylococcus equorum]
MEIKAERFFHTKSVGVIKVGKSKYIKEVRRHSHDKYSIELTSNIEKAYEFSNTPHSTRPIDELTAEVLKYTDGGLIEIEYFGVVEREK